MMDWTTLVVGVLGGSGLTGLFSYLGTRKTAATTEKSIADNASDKLIGRLSDEIKRIDVRLNLCEERHEECEIKLGDLKKRVDTLEIVSPVASYEVKE